MWIDQKNGIQSFVMLIKEREADGNEIPFCFVFKFTIFEELTETMKQVSIENLSKTHKTRK